MDETLGGRRWSEADAYAFMVGHWQHERLVCHVG
jgi:hypothetical protein